MNEKRPELSKELDPDVFRGYYYLKKELVEFCRENRLPVSGGKLELTQRIARYLAAGDIGAGTSRSAPKSSVKELSESAEIEANFVCSEKHRAFFKEKIGSGFSFNVAFQKWLKKNTGKTYAQAIEAYRQILLEKKTKKTEIGRQFEYNTYIRDFFADNPGKTLQQAIACWNFKKARRGGHRYERSDLAAMKE